MIPEINARYKAIGGETSFILMEICPDRSVRLVAEHGVLEHKLSYQQFVEFWEPDNEAVAP